LIRLAHVLNIQLKIAEGTCAFFATLGLALSILNYEIEISLYNNYNVERLILWLNMITTIFLCTSIYFRYDIILRWKISRKELTPLDNLMNTENAKKMIIELIITVISPIPFLKGITYSEYYEDFDTTVVYPVNLLLLAVTFVRMYNPLRYFLRMTNFMNSRSVRVTTINACEANYMFALKALMKDDPFKMLFIGLLLSTTIAGYLLRVFERPLSDETG
jgi:hypothetical protein